MNASLDWSTTFPELTEVEWSYTRSFGDVPQALLSPPELLVLDLKRNNISSIAHLDFSAAGNLEQFDVSHNSIDGTVPGGLADDTFITVVELGSVFCPRRRFEANDVTVATGVYFSGRWTCVACVCVCVSFIVIAMLLAP